MFEVEAPPLSVAEIADDPDQTAACLAEIGRAHV